MSTLSQWSAIAKRATYPNHANPAVVVMWPVRDSQLFCSASRLSRFASRRNGMEVFLSGAVAPAFRTAGSAD